MTRGRMMHVVLAVAITACAKHPVASAQGSREFVLYQPTRSVPASSRALVVMLHGCVQNARDFATGTRMNAQADTIGFYVLYPEQPASANAQKCWNWFTPSESRRGQGEVAILAALIDSIAAAHKVSANRIALVGMSAGAAMAANLMVAYPERYGALAMHSGIAALAATDVASAVAIMRTGPAAMSTSKGSLGQRALAAMGSHAKGIPVVLLHGDADKVVAPINMQAAVQQFTEVNAATPGKRAPVEQHLLPGIGHAWSGGAAEGSYTAPTGPDATSNIVQFLRRAGVLP